MRYSGGMLAGSWLTALTSDMGNGKFDGAWLVQNFENLNPANTLWAAVVVLSLVGVVVLALRWGRYRESG